MTKVSEVPVSEVMDDECETVQVSDSLSSVKNKMEDSRLRAIPVVDEKNNLEGAIGYRDLIRHIQFNPETAKLDKVMHQPPEFDASGSLVDLCELRINSGQKMLVHTQGNKLKGIVSDRQFLEAFQDVDELEGVSTRDIAPTELLRAFKQDSIEEARHKMLDNNVSRLPVLDKDGNLTGIITSVEMLRALVAREPQGSGGASGNRQGNEYFSSGGGEKESMNDIPVSEIMDRTVATSEGHISGEEAVEKMIEQSTDELVIVKDRYPQSIVTVKDFIDHFSEFGEKETMLVSLVGLDVAEEKAAVHQKIRTQLQGSLGRKLDRPEEIKLRFKKAEKDGKRHRYEVTIQLVTQDYVLNVEEEDWDLLDVVDSALEELDTRVKKKTGRD